MTTEAQLSYTTVTTEAETLITRLITSANQLTLRDGHVELVAQATGALALWAQLAYVIAGSNGSVAGFPNICKHDHARLAELIRASGAAPGDEG